MRAVVLSPALWWWGCRGLVLCGSICTSVYVNVSVQLCRINAQGAIAGLYGRSDFSFKRKSQLIFPSDFLILYSHQQ